MTTETAVKSLEQRITERAMERLTAAVERKIGSLMSEAGKVEDQPSGIGNLSIHEAAEKLGKAIIHARAKHECDEALDAALGKLADNLDSDNW